MLLPRGDERSIPSIGIGFEARKSSCGNPGAARRDAGLEFGLAHGGKINRAARIAGGKPKAAPAGFWGELTGAARRAARLNGEKGVRSGPRPSIGAAALAARAIGCQLQLVARESALRQTELLARRSFGNAKWIFITELRFWQSTSSTPNPILTQISRNLKEKVEHVRLSLLHFGQTEDQYVAADHACA